MVKTHLVFIKMKWLLLLSALIPSIYGLGEPKPIAVDDDVTKLASFALDQLNDKKEFGAERSMSDVDIISATKQLVNGFVYDIVFQVGDGKTLKECEVKVYETFSKTKELMKYVCKPKVNNLGGEKDAAVDDDVHKAVHAAMEFHNDHSNNLFVGVPQSVSKVTKQTVEGVLYKFDVHVADTVCTKMGNYKEKDLKDCSVNPSGMVQDCSYKVQFRNWKKPQYVVGEDCQPAQEAKAENSVGNLKAQLAEKLKNALLTPDNTLPLFGLSDGNKDNIVKQIDSAIKNPKYKNEIEPLAEHIGQGLFQAFNELSGRKVQLGGDDHDLKPHGKLIGGDDHDLKPHGKLIGGDDHDLKPHGKLIGGDDHDLKPHGKLIGGDDHDLKPHGKLIGGDDHDLKPHGKLIGGDDHDLKPHGKLIGGDDHDLKPHGKLIGGDDHDLKPHGKLIGGDDHDLKPHGKLIGGDDHDLKPHGKLIGGDDHDLKPHGSNRDLLGLDDHDFKPHGKLIGGDDHDYKPHEKEGLLGRDGHDLKAHGLFGGDDHDLKPHGDPSCDRGKFKEFQLKYNHFYTSSDEENKRFEVFCQNMAIVKQLNNNEQGTAVYGATKFADLSPSEFQQKYLSKKTWDKIPNHGKSMMNRAKIPSGTPPKAFDWRDHGAVTPVKNQGSCGSCWAFSTTGNIEGQWQISRGKLVSLSEQELVDCDKLDDGCEGGLPSNAYVSIMKLGGLETESEYKYEGADEKCMFNKSEVRATINGAVNISSNEDEMAAWLAQNGPISIGINAFAMQFYFGGISHPFSIFCNPKNLDHGVLIVGYGVEGTEPYWIVKNSWGPDWGEKGYYLVYRGAGVCGLNTMCTSAVVNKA